MHPHSSEEIATLELRFRRPRVFIIDDEVAVLELLAGYLEADDHVQYDLRTFDNAFDGLKAIARHKPEVALVDLKMPGLHGLELVAQAQENSPATSFIVITGFTTIDTLLEAIRKGVHDYLTKPFSSGDAVRLVVRNAVKKHRLEAALLMQSTVTGSILRLGELSCVGEGRDEFFTQVRDVFFKLTDATAVLSVYRHAGRFAAHIDCGTPLSPMAIEQLQVRGMEAMGIGELDPKMEVFLHEKNPRGETPPVPEFATLLPISILSTDGIEAQLVVAHVLPEAFPEDVVHTAVALAHNVSIIVQRQFLGASHEHQMIVDLLHHLKDGVVVLDREYHIRYVNPQARRILRLEDKAPLQDALDALAVVDKSLASPGKQRNFMASLQKQVAARVEGEERFFDVEAYTFYTPARVAYRMILFRDVTHLRKEKRKIERLNRQLNSLNAELMERNQRLEAVIKELDSFAYIASHDLQEPFRHIEIFVQFLERDMAAERDIPESVRYHMDQIEQNVDIAKRLLADLRTLSKLTRMRNPYRKVDMMELVEEVVSRFDSAIEQTQARIIINDMPAIVCDPLKIKEVYHNIISNAFKYYDKDYPEITIGAQDEADEMVFFVRDNGIGIDAQYHDYIFQPCRRIPFRTETRGSGLGLAIVKKIIEEHGGRIWVESEKGQGSTFKFTVPEHQVQHGSA